MPSPREKAQTFKALHEQGNTFIIPNPWDAGSAMLLQAAGAKALATTSSGFAQSIGKLDGEITLEEKLQHCRLLSSVTDIPINADFEHGFADSPTKAAHNLSLLCQTGVAGGSIEDYSRTKIYDFNLAVERVAACAEVVVALDLPFTFTARAEGLFRKTHSLDEVIERLQAFEKAGADVLYAPGLKSLEEIELVLSSVSRPVNVLAPFMPSVSFEDYARLGVARISVGGALAAKVKKATLAEASKMFDSGRFD